MTADIPNKENISNSLANRNISLLVVLPLIVLDQLTKFLINKTITISHEKIVVIPNFFHIVHVRNRGAAWGMFSNYGIILLALSFIFLFFILYYQKNLIENRKSFQWALSLITAGIIGNLIDRMFYGEVIDFLCFFYKNFQWPSFNVADSSICVGVGIYILFSFLNPKDSEENEKLEKINNIK
ncbi:MAG: signal peptidase II [Verrucomicrobiota bacterium]|nr:signal peptidase II [Verrucomicrobiota bacterium]